MPIEGVLPVIPTPFRDGAFDQRSFERLLEHMLPYVDGYTLLGSTGEAPSLTTSERTAIAEAALALTPRDKTVVVGVTHTSSRDAVTLARHAQEHGARAVLCAAPFYFANTPAGVCAFLAEIERGLEIDLVFYDNPVSTKTRTEPDDVLRWREQLPLLTGVKLTDHDLGKIPIWQEAGLRVYGGDDPIAFRYLAAGVDGVMMIAPALFPEPFRCVWNLVQGRRLDDGFEVFASEILPLLHVLGIGDEIATTKELFQCRGWFQTADVAAPLTPVDANRRSLLALADAHAASQTACRRVQTIAASRAS